MGVLGVVLSVFKNMKKAKKLKAMGAEEILKLNDFDFYDAVECLCDAAVYDINDSGLTQEQRYVHTLIRLEAEVNNGGLCQFFVNSSKECAPFVRDALNEIGATQLSDYFIKFVNENNIDVNDLSRFNIQSVDEFAALSESCDFDKFDDRFYEDEDLHQQILDYARENIYKLI